MLPTGSDGVITADMRCAYRDLEAHLRPFVARRVSDASAVDDVLQDVFLRMQRSLADLREEERFGPWAYQVARRAIAEHRRARARHPIATGDAPELAVDPSEDKDDRAVERDLATYIAPFIAMLPTPYREALTLTELEGLTQKDAAEMIGASLSGMKSRVARGRQRLRKLLEDCCEIALDARGRVIECQPRTDDCCCDGGPRQSLSTKQLPAIRGILGRAKGNRHA
jgi:RNA polymerase sigma-70 factor (ECF subfamily)